MGGSSAPCSVVWGSGLPGGAFSGGSPVQAALTGPRPAARPPLARCARALLVPQAQHGAGRGRVPEPEPSSSRLGGDAALRGRDGQTLAPPPGVPAPQCRRPGPLDARGSRGRRGEREPSSAAPAARLLLHGLGKPCLPGVPVPSKSYG